LSANFRLPRGGCQHQGARGLEPFFVISVPPQIYVHAMLRSSNTWACASSIPAFNTFRLDVV
jgi:hypothetical protein